MESNLLPEDPERLLDVAEEIVEFLSQNQSEVDVPKEAEALLRASIAGTAFARSRYLAVLASAGESPVAARFLGEARTASRRAEDRLRRRLTSVIAKISVLAYDCP